MIIIRSYLLSLFFLYLFFTISGTEQQETCLELLPAATIHLDGADFSYNLNPRLDFTTPGFRLLADMSILNDRKYSPDEVYFLGHYLYLNENSVSFSSSNARFTAGRLIARSLLNTPYSLYLSSHPIPSVGMDFLYTTKHFFYNNRWIRLNERSNQKYPDDRTENDGYWLDRGLNHKTFGLSFAPWRFGIQDSVVYLERSFDWEYFLSPMPQIFVQLVTTSSGKPWTEQNNDNSLMGFFCEYDQAPVYAVAQLLVDDINASFLPLVDVENLSKLAWSLGGSYNTPWGKIGFYHGGATKYTFAATYAYNSYSDLPYEYTYFPATEYRLKDGTWLPLLPEDNYLGYLYGENNLAFRFTYDNIFFADTLPEFSLTGSLEWVLNGSKSPANPWHEYGSWLDIAPAYELLSDAVIEQILRINCRVEKPLHDFTFLLDLTLGGKFNGLLLAEVAANEPKIFRPQAGNDSFLFQLQIGVNYRWRVF